MSDEDVLTLGRLLYRIMCSEDFGYIGPPTPRARYLTLDGTIRDLTDDEVDAIDRIPLP
jgi:hypothetical protein